MTYPVAPQLPRVNQERRVPPSTMLAEWLVHMQNVSIDSFALAQHMGYCSEHAELVRIAALKHDMKKLAAPFSENIFLNSEIKELSPEQRVVVNQHALEGAEMFMQLRYVYAEYCNSVGDIALMIACHHDRYDNSGRNFENLASEKRFACRSNLPVLGAQIIKVVDAYWAMTEPRRYRKGPPMEKFEAIKSLYSSVKSGELCPHTYAAFANMIENRHSAALEQVAA